jgi:hypothetical protein
VENALVKFTLVALLVALGWLSSGCMLSDQRTEAESINRRIRAMPGVSDTRMEYGSPFSSSGRFRLSVTLGPSVTEAQATDVGRVFVDQVHRQGFRDFDIEFEVNYGDSSSTAHYYFKEIGGNTYARTDIPDSIAVWLRAARSPVTKSASTEAWYSHITVVLRAEATAADAEALQRSDPGLANATWCLEGHRYCSDPTPPSDHDKKLWTEIIAAVGTDNEADGVTGSYVRDLQAKTEIGIAIKNSTNIEATKENVARSVAPLLSQFGHPTALVVEVGIYRPAPEERDKTAIEIVVGGCYRHTPYHQPQPLELELSKTYEKC